MRQSNWCSMENLAMTQQPVFFGQRRREVTAEHGWGAGVSGGCVVVLAVEVFTMHR